MNERDTLKRGRCIAENKETEAAVAFTSRTDGSRHRYRFLQLEEHPEMVRVHELKEDQTWRIIGCEPIHKLRIGQAESHPDHVGQHVIE